MGRRRSDDVSDGREASAFAPATCRSSTSDAVEAAVQQASERGTGQAHPASATARSRWWSAGRPVPPSWRQAAAAVPVSRCGRRLRPSVAHLCDRLAERRVVPVANAFRVVVRDRLHPRVCHQGRLDPDDLGPAILRRSAPRSRPPLLRHRRRSRRRLRPADRAGRGCPTGARRRQLRCLSTSPRRCSSIPRDEPSSTSGCSWPPTVGLAA